MATAADWASGMGRTWARLSEATDRQFAYVTGPLAKALATRPGERILDLGCGSGATTLALARAVAPDGHATGLDISPDQIAAAETRAEGCENIDFIFADGGSHPFGPATFDALHSRHGGMFFDDPPAAFANIRNGLKPGARVVMSAFAPIAENPWASVPMAAADSLLAGVPPTPEGAAGPFAWAVPETSVGPALVAAGFSKVRWQAHRVPFILGSGDDPDPVRRAVAHVLEIGVLARRLKAVDDPDALRPALEASLAATLSPHVSGGWVRLDATFWLVEARA